MAKRPLRLYWCWTDDHHEDWFVVARTAGAARRFHMSAEGYDAAEALLVADVPDALRDAPCPDWPSDELLLACGARILREETPRVVEIGGQRYAEGMLEQIIREVSDDAYERAGRGRPNRTPRPSRVKPS